MKVPARETSTALFQSQRWEQSLSDIHHPLPADSLIPMFEGMVDRALSRNHQDATAVRDKRAPWDPEATPTPTSTPALNARKAGASSKS